MNKLTGKSREIYERFVRFRERCQAIAFTLGKSAAGEYWQRFKGNPECEEALEEFDTLISSKSN